MCALRAGVWLAVLAAALADPAPSEATCKICEACARLHKAGGCGNLGDVCCCLSTQARAAATASPHPRHGVSPRWRWLACPPGPFAPLQAEPKVTGCCPIDGTYCQFFQSAPPGGPGTCPAPSLCLPAPQGPCGRAAEPCCPPRSSIGDDWTCAQPDLKCAGAGVNTTSAAYLEFAKDPRSVPPAAYGTCVPRA